MSDSIPSQLLNPETNGKAACPDPEVLEKPVRRKFTAAYKLEMVEAADRCSELGQIGALLRREGLYSSQLSTCSAATTSLWALVTRFGC